MFLSINTTNIARTLHRHKIGSIHPMSSIEFHFLFPDIKPKLKNHYRAHRLSFWLNLVPDLHRTGTDDVPYSHHQLVDDDLDRKHTGPTVKPLNPPQTKNHGNNGSNYSVYTTQMFSLLNLSSNSNKSNQQQRSSGSAAGTADDHETNELLGNDQNASSDDGFAAYSTALSVTIAIGCSLLILNVLIFAGVYYQRDKTRLNEPRNGSAGQMGHHGTLNSVLKKRNENGQMPNNICGELETLTIHTKNDQAQILGHHNPLQHHQMPPPEFADIPQRAPPPPKHMKTMICDGNMSTTAGTNQMMPAHAMQLIGANCTGTLQKPKSCVKNSNSGANSHAASHSHNVPHQMGQCHGQNQMDELRV